MRPSSNFINTPCTIIRRTTSGETDKYGDEIPAESIVHTVCEIQQRRRTEGTADELSDTVWDVYFLPGEVIDGGDALAVPGLGDFELIGNPYFAKNSRTQEVEQIEATARQVAGPDDLTEGGSGS